MKKVIIGKNFLHTHPMKENELELDRNHVIVDKDELDKTIKFINSEEQLVEKFTQYLQSN